MKKKIIGALIVFAIIITIVFIKPQPQPISRTYNKIIPTKDAFYEPERVGPKPNFNLTVPAGYQIGEFAKNLPNARDLQFSPSGILLVSLTASGRVVALPDNDRDGVADQAVEILSGLQRPHGLAFYNGILYVAEETKVSKYNFNEKTLKAEFEKKLFDLPAGGRHFTRSLVFDNKGNLYVSLGSTCDTCVEKNPFISTVLTSNSEGEGLRIFSSGLRNAVFLAVNPNTQKVWATEMGRDFLGDETPPDEINILNNGENYGWPYCYSDKLIDKTFPTKNKSFCEKTIAPFFKVPAHSAPLGLAFMPGSNDLLVAYHGSWNRSIPTGYKIVKINTLTKEPQDFITGFSNMSARPVDVVFDSRNSLYISDDKSGTIYKVIKTQ